MRMRAINISIGVYMLLKYSKYKTFVVSVSSYTYV